ncbi:unnamed protein product, partial [Leptidea sinapis]
MSSVEFNLDLNNEDLSSICRSCLSPSVDLKNMIDWGLAGDFYKATDILKRILTTPQIYETEETHTVQNTITINLQDSFLTLYIIAPNKDEKLDLPCPYNCDQKFLKKTHLQSHMVKFHGKQKDFIVDLKFNCNHVGCQYHADSGKEKYFSNRKLLNQHYRKVHDEKNILCDVCKLKFSSETDYNRHVKTCNFIYLCQICDKAYADNERLLVHLMRKHPDLHEQHKEMRKVEKRKSESSIESKKMKSEAEKFSEYICDSPKRSFATQTLEENIRNDVTLSWQPETKTDEISTQTVFEDLLSLKSQTSEDESIFCSETVSLSVIQTQTFPLEFGLMRSNKETITSGTHSPDLSIKETQTCFCLYDSPKPRSIEGISSNSNTSFSMNFISTETQTLKGFVDDMSVNSAETQTSFDDIIHDNDL